MFRSLEIADKNGLGQIQSVRHGRMHSLYGINGGQLCELLYCSRGSARLLRNE